MSANLLQWDYAKSRFVPARAPESRVCIIGRIRSEIRVQLETWGKDVDTGRITCISHPYLTPEDMEK